MKIIKDSKQLNLNLKLVKKTQNNIAFIPTMGSLHQGHLELIKQAKLKADIIIVSIFVNPKQFDSNSDFLDYPENLSQDIKLLEELSVDYLFIPLAKDFYSEPFLTEINLAYNHLKKLCGLSRADHFSGVALVLVKLFNIIQPQSVFFGLKDYQQCLLVKAIIKDLNYDIELVKVEIIREKTGLAMSSRNNNLNEKERNLVAPLLYKELKQLKEQIPQNINQIKNLIIDSKHKLTACGFKVDYLELLNNDLEDCKSDLKNARLFIAAFLGEVRLIDNIALCQ
jgi:pantoate--beta-alanine ligase